MAEAIVSVVLESFRDLLVEEAKLLGGVSGQVEALEAELERMMSFLKDADARQHEGDGVHSWVKQVRNLAYRAQDVLEKYAIQVRSNKKSGLKKLLRKFACVSLHNIAMEIETIKCEIVNLRESLQTYGINPTNEGELIKAANEKQRLIRQTFAHGMDVDFVGMEDDVRNLVSFLVDESRFKIISIHGMGGSGKTATARNVFNHPEVKQVFDGVAWVCITQNCEKIVVLQDILKQLTKEDSQNTSFAELVRDIAKVVQEKKCFVVLDDIWNIDDWKILSRAFLDATSKSKVLITTRKYNVAKVGYLHGQRLLDEEESLQLLHKKVFNSRNEHTDPRLVKLFGDLGRGMIRKCGGLPLAISTLGGILRSKFSVKEWMAISKDIGSTLSEGLDSLEDSESTNKILALSYQDLPHFLKPCFLYMSVFREDEVINPRKLYHMWIAEGMVSPGYLLVGETLMNVAERFLQELSLRCVVELQMDKVEGKVESCRLHDLMRDLCLKKAKEEEFLERVEIDLQGGQSAMIDTSILDNARRLAIHLYMSKDYSNGVVVFDQLTRHQLVRSLSVVGQWNSYIRKVDTSEVARFKLLRVLNFENLRSHEMKLPVNIGELIHLRFLSLYGCGVTELPSSVGDLSFLQTLDLRGRDFIIKIPHDIFSKKKQLRHLYLGMFDTVGPLSNKLKLDGLSELESLVVEYDISKLDLGGLSRLVNLRYFYYHNLGNAKNDWPLIIEQTKHWKKIEHLEISMKDGDDEEDVPMIFMSQHITHVTVYGCKIRFPPYEPQFCLNLVSLKLLGCPLDDGLMQLVGNLPNLRRFIVDSVKKFKEINFTKMAFPQLRLLQLMSCEKLKIGEGSLPNLTTLEIVHCKEIEPEDGLKYLHNLEECRFVNESNASEVKDKCLRHHHQYVHVSIIEDDLFLF